MIEPEARMVERAQQLIARTRREQTSTLPEAEIIDIIATIAVYKFANLSREEVEAMLGLSVEQTKVYQEAKSEGRAEGQEEGRQEILAVAVPLLLQAGMTIAQIAEHLKVDVMVIQQAARRSSEPG